MAGRPRSFVAPLTSEERGRLEKIAGASTSQARHAERAKVILAVADGWSNKQIEEVHGVSRVTISKVLKKWTTLGIDAALNDYQRSGRPNTFDFSDHAWVISLACQKPKGLKDGPSAELWTKSLLTKYIQKHCEAAGHPLLKDVSETTVWKILNKNNIKPHRVQYYLQKKDSLFESKAQEVLLLYKRVEWILQFLREDIKQGERADRLCGEVIISYDEKPGIQAIGNIAPDLLPTKGHGAVGRDYEYKRYGTVSLLAGIDLLTGEVTGIVKDTHTSEDFIEFLTALDQKYDKSLTIKMVLDNHSVHRSKAVTAFLLSHPGRFEFTFTPKHASWLNLVESFFSKFAKQALRHLRVSSKAELVQHIEKWIEEVNAEPVLYRWKWALEDIQSIFTH